VDNRQYGALLSLAANGKVADSRLLSVPHLDGLLPFDFLLQLQDAVQQCFGGRRASRHLQPVRQIIYG
jgi:hypothetical protein